MYKSICCAIFCYLLVLRAVACPTSLNLTSQLAIDNFATTYPSCASISGTVYIAEDVGPITSLRGLSNLTSVGTLLIVRTSGLSNLAGLENLVTVGGTLSLSNNLSLVSLSGMDNLTEVQGDLSMYNHPLLSDISALDKLENIEGGFYFVRNSAMTDLSGLGKLQSIGELYYLYDNDALAAITGFNSLNTIGDYLYIWEHERLLAVKGLQQLSTIGGSFSVGNNPALTALSQPASLRTIGGELQIINNDQLFDISGLAGINPATLTGLQVYGTTALSNCELASFCTYIATTSAGVRVHSNAAGCNSVAEISAACQAPQPCLAGGITLQTQAEIDAFAINHPTCTHITGDVRIIERVAGDITSLAGLQQITQIDGSLIVANSQALPGLGGLEGLVSIGRTLQISGNTLLTSLEGLSNVSTIGEGIYVADNAALPALAGLEQISITGFITLTNNPALEHLDGLRGLTGLNRYLQLLNNNRIPNLRGLAHLVSVGEFLSITQNDGLLNLSGLEKLQSVGGHLIINSNPALNSLAALQTLTQISGQLSIAGNQQLVELQGIENIDPAGIQELKITYSPNLSNCEIAMICAYLTDGNRPATIANNGCGCRSPEEVMARCNNGYQAFKAQCRAATVYLDAQGTAIIPIEAVYTAPEDPCLGPFSVHMNREELNCADIRPAFRRRLSIVPVTLTMSDINGNQASCVARVEVVDDIVPVARCRDLRIALPRENRFNLLPTEIDNGSSDACSFELSLNRTSFTCDDLGEQTVTLTVEDKSGNRSSCEARLTVSRGESTCPSSGNSLRPAVADEKASLPGLHLYPNPATDEVSVGLPGTPLPEGAYLCVVDTYGRLVLQQKVSSTQQRLSLSELPAGLYLVQLQRADGAVLSARLLLLP